MIYMYLTVGEMSKKLDIIRLQVTEYIFQDNLGLLDILTICRI